jgi:integrase/recombinase XerD
VTDLDLADLLESWQTHLEAERKSVNTVRLYVAGVRGFLAWAASNEAPDRTRSQVRALPQVRPASNEAPDRVRSPTLDRATVNAYIAELLRQGAEPATARARQLALRLFAAWLVEEGELEHNPLAGLKPPKLDAKIVPVLDDSQLRALLRACDGKGLADRRDEALIRVMLETGIRAGEAVALTVADVNVRGGLLFVQRGKGGKGRMVAFGPATARSLDRYLRLRRNHRLADSAPLWLGEAGHGFTYDGLHRALRRRARAAGIDPFWPHMLRHTMASRWLAKGGSEGGLLAVAGWSHRMMLERYAAHTRSERAAAEARTLNLGDL